jgi:hypothetical protein
VILAGSFEKILAGFGDCLTLGLAAQVRKPPSRQRTLLACVLNPGGRIVMRFVRKHKRFLAPVASRAALTDSRREFEKDKGAAMKFATVSKSLIMGVALLLASSAFASSKASLQLSAPAVINGTTLQPGEYKVEWDGTGPNVEVSFLKGKNVVAKASGKVVDLASPAPGNTVILSKGDNGSDTIAAVRFEGKKFSLAFGSSDGAGGSSK